MLDDMFHELRAVLPGIHSISLVYTPSAMRQWQMIAGYPDGSIYAFPIEASSREAIDAALAKAKNAKN